MLKSFFRSRKMIVVYIVATLLVLGVAAALLIPKWLAKDEKPIFLTQKAPDDFSDTFAVADRDGADILALSVSKVETVTDVIERYDVAETTYTKISATVERDFTGYHPEKNICIYVLGTTENFPQREQLVKGRTYVLTLTPWAHESGVIYLLNPLQSTFTRLFENELIVRQNAKNAYYMMTGLSPDDFAAQLSQYRAAHTPDPAARQNYLKEMCDDIAAFDYDREDLAYNLPQKDRAARKKLAEELAKK